MPPFRLQILPFECAFDILFRFGGFDAMQRTFNKLPKLGNDAHSEAIHACMIVKQLTHPAKAIFLLQPVQTDIPDSVEAWSVARSIPFSRPAVLDAMKRFITTRFALYEWYDSADLGPAMRTMETAAALAAECIENQRFINEVWRDVRCIGEHIARTAEAEMAQLEKAVFDDEWVRVTSLYPKNKRVSFQQQEFIKHEAEKRNKAHLKMLDEIQTLLLKSLDVGLFDAQFPFVARLVRSLCSQHPRIEWNIRKALHEAAIDRLGLPVWYIERELWRQHVPEPDPLFRLRNLRT